jgi:hypothetical protein
MEKVTDRIMLILKEKLPGVLQKINMMSAAADIARWGVPLTLYPPNEILYGPDFNIGEMPAMQVIFTGGSGTNQGENETSFYELNYDLFFYFAGDTPEPLQRMQDRYLIALLAVLRGNIRLENPLSNDNPLSVDVEITSFAPTVIGINNNLYNTVKVSVKYKCPCVSCEWEYKIF